MAYWFDIAPAVAGEWLDWYLADHMPSRVGNTFSAGRCYEAIDAPSSHMVLFETPTPQALLAPSYLSLLKVVSEEDRQRRGWYAGTIRVLCRVTARAGKGTGSVLGVVRIAGAHARRDEIVRCLRQEVVPALARPPRIGAAWLLENDAELRRRIDAARVTGHQDGSADWALLVEGGHEEDVRAALASLDSLSSWQALELGASALTGVYRLLFTMSQDMASTA